METSKEQDIKVFVYGTLKQGYGNHRVMQESNGVSQGSWVTKDSSFGFVDLGPFPAALMGGDKKILGELYTDISHIRFLDGLEGYPSLYDRKRVTVNPVDISNGKAVIDESTEEEAWIYFMRDTSATQQCPPLVLWDDEHGETVYDEILVWS